VVTVAADGVLGVHRWSARRVADPRAPLGKGQALPLTVELDPTVAGLPEQRRRLPWPLEETTAPAPTLFALAPDGRTLVSGGHWDATVRVTVADTGKPLQARHVDTVVTAVALAEDGSLLATGTQTGAVLVWEMNARTGRIADGAAPTVLVAHDYPVTAVAVCVALDTVASLSPAGVALHALARARFVRILARPGAAPPQLLRVHADGFVLVTYPAQTLGTAPWTRTRARRP
jgi:neurobeachin-like protein 1/2